MTPPKSPLIPHWPACLLLGLGLLLAQAASAKCELTNNTETKTQGAAPIPFGRVNLRDLTLQPYGSLLASVVVPPTNYTYKGATADTVLWKCDKDDLASPELYFLVSTNGNSRFGGHNEIGGPDLPNVYGTWFKHIGLRLSMDGVEFTRHWKKVPLRPNQYKEVRENRKDRIHIRLGDLPPLHAELFRVETETPEKGHRDRSSMNCGDYNRGASAPKPEGTLHNCKWPNGYIQLHGPGLKNKQDEEGQDHHTHIKAWNAGNGFAYSLYQAMTLSNTATCVLHSATPSVHFKPVSAQQLNSPNDGADVTETVSLTVNCDNRDVSGTDANQTAIGFQVSSKAFAAASGLNLVKDGGVEFLVSDDYDQPGMAQGVGIGLFDMQGQQRRFLGMPGIVADKINPKWDRRDFIKHAHPKGPDAGWHPVLQDAKWLGPSSAGHLYAMNFTFKLMKLPQADKVTPGKVRATAHVLVKVQ